MASLSSEFNFQQFTDEGEPLALGRVYTYAAGTTTHKTVYTDAAGLVPHLYTNDLAGGQYIALDARGEMQAPMFLASGAYWVTLKRADGSTVWTRYAKGAGDVYSSELALYTAAGTVGYSPVLPYAQGTLGRALSSREWNCADYPWLAKFDDVADDTAAIAACWAACYAAGVSMGMPHGTARVTSVPMMWTDSRTVNVRGQGKGVTRLRKIGTAATPVLDISNTGTASGSPILNINSEFSDFSIIGNNMLHPGLQMKNCATFTLKNLAVTGCDVGFENMGSLVFSAYDCDFSYNAAGYRQRKLNSIYCNLINFYGCRINNNSSLGASLDHGSNLNFWGVDFEVNGTAGVSTSGAVLIYSTVGEETSESIINFNGGWFERNFGTPFAAQAAVTARIKISNVPFFFNDAGVGLNVGAVNTLTLDHVHSSDSFVVGSDILHIKGSVLSNLTDNALVSVVEAAQVNSALIPWKVRQYGLNSGFDPITGVLSVSNAGLNVGTGGITVASPVLMASSVALGNNAGTGAGTLTNAPSAGPPTKWVRINDNGTLRSIPTWT